MWSTTPRGGRRCLDSQNHIQRSPRGTSSTKCSKRGSQADAKAVPIRVIARIRPMLNDEIFDEDVVSVHSDSRTLIVDGPSKRKFVVDDIFDSRFPEVSQSVVFEGIGRDLVRQSVQGINICILAYGHTGSGKTFTMVGDGITRKLPTTFDVSGAGLISRFIHELFEVPARDPTYGKARHRCEFYEVYNEQVNDLLTNDQRLEHRRRTIHVHPKHGVWIAGLSTSLVNSASEALELLHLGSEARTVASTTMNARSSRSHAIFSFHFEHGLQGTGKGHRESIVTFVDLAGREDQTKTANKDAQLREMCYINTSLFHLTRVITKLSEARVPTGSLLEFRNSKLTLLLSQAFTGNSQTMLVATVASARSYFDDTVSTLSFAQAVKKIRTNPVVNDKASPKIVEELEAEVAHLRRELCSAKAQGADERRELANAEALISKYKQSWQEALRHSEELKRDKLMKASFGAHSGLVRDMQSNGLVPFLTKLTDDPCLQGCANYFLSGALTRIGSDMCKCQIVLQGVGIEPIMCEVTRKPEQQLVQVRLVGSSKDDLDEVWDTNEDEEPRVLVKGLPLDAGQNSRHMQHGDCLFLGYSHAFRLIVPTDEILGDLNDRDAISVARSSVESLDMQGALAETTEHAGTSCWELCPYVMQLRSRVEETLVQQLLVSLRRVSPLIDEANLLTRQVLGEVQIRFKVQVLTDVLDNAEDEPKLAVCILRQSVPTAPSTPRQANLSSTTTSLTPRASPKSLMSPRNAALPRGTRTRSNSLVPDARMTLARSMGLANHMFMGASEELVYIWSLDKFLHRLEGMRNVYELGLETQDEFDATRAQLKAKPDLNPWREVAFTVPKDTRGMKDEHLNGACDEKHDSTKKIQASKVSFNFDSSASEQRGSMNSELVSTSTLHKIAAPSSPSVQAQIAARPSVQAHMAVAPDTVQLPAPSKDSDTLESRMPGACLQTGGITSKVGSLRTDSGASTAETDASSQPQITASDICVATSEELVRKVELLCQQPKARLESNGPETSFNVLSSPRNLQLLRKEPICVATSEELVREVKVLCQQSKRRSESSGPETFCDAPASPRTMQLLRKALVTFGGNPAAIVGREHATSAEGARATGSSPPRRVVSPPPHVSAAPPACQFRGWKHVSSTRATVGVPRMQQCWVQNDAKVMTSRSISPHRTTCTRQTILPTWSFVAPAAPACTSAQTSRLDDEVLRPSSASQFHSNPFLHLPNLLHRTKITRELGATSLKPDLTKATCTEPVLSGACVTQANVQLTRDFSSPERHAVQSLIVENDRLKEEVNMHRRKIMELDCYIGAKGSTGSNEASAVPSLR